MGYGSLFERLNGETVGRNSQLTEESLAASILNHLNKLLQTRQGTVLCLPDYGLPDLNDGNASIYDSINRIRRHVGWIISRYEPRLSGIRVIYVPDAGSLLALRFRITGTMQKDGLVAPLTVGVDVYSGSELRLQRVV
ncbi:type VI secretion system lysozyme-related protein [Tolumonas auensis DSM 9187]|uniref:Type VI secretion system lysozyme-related protein n=1 Tax=Tolumonas auensis (strain DSM 9187 / NBRC 110442 / TA 4) TaxID=595494 RepID=C4L827_TOLAT|nr:type VI secretion system baseplate subunit TssE [Tolumonas auensis]ACQ91826.1 type VI secretion system lysozyme-related protein [Tolumonas auensis DSM 9187]